MIEISNTTTTSSAFALPKYVPVPPPVDCGDTFPAAPYRGESSGFGLTGVSSYEELYRIQGNLGAGLYLQYQLPVRVWIEGAEFVAEQKGLRLHAFGDSQTEAILNLREEIADHYQRLEQRGDRLSPALKKDRAILRKLLGKDA